MLTLKKKGGGKKKQQVSSPRTNPLKLSMFLTVTSDSEAFQSKQNKKQIKLMQLVFVQLTAFC